MGTDGSHVCCEMKAGRSMRNAFIDFGDRRALRFRKRLSKGVDFDFMRKLTDGDLTHDAVRTLEGGLIRQTLDKQLGRSDGFDSVKDALSKTTLLNKNRGSITDNWIKDADGIPDDLWDLLKVGGDVVNKP